MSPAAPDRIAAVYDSLDTIPEFAAVAEGFRDRDWPALEAALSELPADEALYALLELGAAEDAEDFLTEAVERHPESDVARTACAVATVFAGWRIRGGASGAEDDALRAFRQHLVRAEPLLIEACAAAQPWAPAWGGRVLTARALEVGLSEGQRRHRHASEHSPHDFATQQHMLQFLLPKWCGTWELAEQFARDAAAQAPSGSNSAALIALVHLERWLDLGGAARGQAHLSHPAVLHELRDAAARSVLHADHASSALSVQAHSAFALVFWLAGENADAAAHLRALDGRASRFPWEYAVSSPDDLAVIRDEVLGDQEKSA